MREQIPVTQHLPSQYVTVHLHFRAKGLQVPKGSPWCRAVGQCWAHPPARPHLPALLQTKT